MSISECSIRLIRNSRFVGCPIRNCHYSILHHIISPIVDEYDELHHILVCGSESKLFPDFISSFILHNLYYIRIQHFSPYFEFPMAKPNPEVVGGQLSRLAALWQPGRRSLSGRQKNGLRARGKRSMTMKYDDLEKLELTGMKLSVFF